MHSCCADIIFMQTPVCLCMSKGYKTLNTLQDRAIITLYFIAGVDFDSTPLTGSIPVGENSTTVVVPIMQDSIIEQNEMFLQLPTAIPGITLGSANMATGTITDSTGINPNIINVIIALIFCLLI